MKTLLSFLICTLSITAYAQNAEDYHRVKGENDGYTVITELKISKKACEAHGDETGLVSSRVICKYYITNYPSSGVISSEFEGEFDGNENNNLGDGFIEIVYIDYWGKSYGQKSADDYLDYLIKASAEYPTLRFIAKSF